MTATTATAGLREVRLYGHLRARYGRSHWLAVDSPAEALRALCALFAGFRQAVLGGPRPGATRVAAPQPVYRVIVDEAERAYALDGDALDLRVGRAGVIRIAPVIHGRKRGGLLQIVVGAALLVAAPYAAAAMFSAFGGFGATASWYVAGATLTGMKAIGKAMILGGVIQLVSPQRQTSGKSRKDSASYTFGSGTNLTEPGGPVPLIIGRMLVASTEVSSGISTDEYTPTGSALPPNPARPPNEMDSIHDDYYNQGA